MRKVLRWRWTVATAVAAAAMMACGNDDEGYRVPAEQQWCDEMCRLYSRCEGPNPGCDGNCAVYNEEYFARSHPDALRLEAECLATSECSDDLETVLSDCYLATLELQPPTDESFEFCEHMSAVFFNCYWFSGPITCAQFFAHSSESAFDDAVGCSATTCELLDSCLAQSLWGASE